ncbi:MAG: TonB-dependent receptor plug domain-containing protein [Proteobacteria bacterium]|nr:TonB-dependent receptor plug domain-containing protein [Pseudomonadota bacterium]
MHNTANPPAPARNDRPTSAAALALLAFGVGAMPHATAQEGPALEEIVVTARKIEENLRDIPLTVSAFTEQALEEQGIASLQDIADATPGFDFAQAFGRNDFRPVIRGQSNILGRANAGLFVDGIIIEQGNASIPLSALQRVEVVKGPQSALYGRSTLAGAVNYVLKTPGNEADAEATLQYGDRDLFRAEIHASAPFSDTAGGAITVAHYERGGEYDNNFAGNALGTPAEMNQVGGESTTSVTGVLTFAPSERVDIKLHAMYEDTFDDHYAIAMNPSSLNNCYQVTRGGPLSQPAPPEGTPEASASLVTSAGYNGSGYYCGEIDVATVLENSGGDGRASLETGFFDFAGTSRESLRLGLRIDADLNDNLTLTSLTGYNDVAEERAQDQTFGGGDTRMPVVGVGSPFAAQPFSARPRIHSRVGFLTWNDDSFDDFSQELRLRFEADSGLNYTLGVYYYGSDDAGQRITSFDTTTSTYIDGTRLFAPFNPRFVPATVSTSTSYEGAPFRHNGSNSIESTSVFGAVEFPVSDVLTIGLEARYNDDEFESVPAGSSSAVSGSFDAFLPKLTVRLQPSDNLLVYANAAKGNKPGTLNTSEGLPAQDQLVDEENATSFEVGVKSLSMDNRVETNVALYTIDWRDMQLTSTRAAVVNGQPRTFSILENVGESSITGLELDLSVRVNDAWNIRLGYAYTDSEIERFVQSVDAGAQAGSAFREAALIAGYSSSGDVIISGTQLPQTSEQQAILSNVFNGGMNNGWSWFLRADLTYNSERYAQVYNLAHTGDRQIVNLRGGFRSDNIDIELWVDNATDDDTSPALIRYVQGRNLTFNPFNRAIGVTLPEQRRGGITARFRF